MNIINDGPLELIFNKFLLLRYIKEDLKLFYYECGVPGKSNVIESGASLQQLTMSL